MKDRIVAAFLDDFVHEFGLAGLDESKAFERFANYCVVSRHHPSSFDPDEISVGGGGDLGLDGLAILVNDHIVSATEDVDHLKKTLRRLDVRFIFSQAKTSPRFDLAEVGSTLGGVREFFDRTIPTHANSRIKSLHAVKEYIFDNSIDMDRNPICQIYYTTTGTWNNEPAFAARVQQSVADLQRTGPFSEVQFVPVDCELLKKLYRELHHKVVREIVFDKHTILPAIDGVQESYIGIVPATEYVKLISDDEGQLNRRLFYDNVRDFQGHNSVNTEIALTVKESRRSDRFALLNNGVTVVARDLNKVGTKFRLKDYQIVNGCQTSHILFINREQLTPNVYLPMKLIVTADSEVTNQVIQGTNRQTEVKVEAFESLAPFQKKLEEFYDVMRRDRKDALYYERRSKQYDHLGIRRNRIVTLATQVKCFLAMFLGEPQSTHRYYGELLSAYKGRIFSASHAVLPYYISGAAVAAFEHFLAEGDLPRAWRHLKYQIAFAWRIQNAAGEMPPFGSNAIEAFCEDLLRTLDDPDNMLASLRKAGQLVQNVFDNAVPQSREPVEHTKAFTSALIDATRAQASGRVAVVPNVVLDVPVGTVKRYSEIRGYGFIETDGGEEIFAHRSELDSSLLGVLKPGQRVQFVIMETLKGRQAVDIHLAAE
jgi:cold shock CspA family protein